MSFYHTPANIRLQKNFTDHLQKLLQIIITAVNKIKCHSAADRLFWELCVENDENFEDLLLHIKVVGYQKATE